MSKLTKLLITGANGFIGRNLVDKYQEEFEIFPVNRNVDLIASLEVFNPDIIFHCSAEIYNDDLMWESNVLYTKKILDFCAKNSQTKLFLFGSSSEYGRKNHPISERDSLQPVTFYESTKATASMLAMGYAEKYKFKTVLIRPFSIVGRFERGHKLFPTLYKAFKNNGSVNISSGYHDFVFIDDFLDAFDTVFRFKHGGNFNTVNIGSGVQTSNYEVYESFARVFGYNIRTNFVDKMRSFDSNNWVCDPTLLREKYKYSVPTNFDVGVRKFIKDCERLGLYND